MKPAPPLVVITRPPAQAESLLQALREAEIPALHQPVLQILPAMDPPALKQALERDKQRYSLALFTSLNAVQQAAALIALPDWLAGKKVFAVGQATAQWLKEHGVQAIDTPTSKQTSEGLLALPALQRGEGRAAALFNAAGGRTLLQQTLRQRGFVVEEFHVYRRETVKTPTPSFQQAVQAQQPLLLTATSTAMLEGLLAMTDPSIQPWLLQQPLIVISPRMAERARILGFTRVLLADNASNPAILLQIQQYMNQEPPSGS